MLLFAVIQLYTVYVRSVPYFWWSQNIFQRIFSNKNVIIFEFVFRYVQMMLYKQKLERFESKLLYVQIVK